MKKDFYLLLTFIVIALVTACSKTGDVSNGPSNGGSSSGGGGGSTTDNSIPYFEYAIGSDNAIHINCAEINFSANEGDVITGVYATSASTKVTFSFSFPAFSGAVEGAGIGAYAVKEFLGYADNSAAFNFSLRAPKTPGGTDYYYSTEPKDDSYKNNVKKIDKGAIESGKQVYWIEGEYKLPAINAAKETTTISGKYRFKIFTLLTASPVLPAVKTTAITDITSTTAKAGGEVTFEGNTTVTARGICWDLVPGPTVAGSKTTNGSGKGAFTSEMTGLLVNTKYYVRAYATNSKGTTYGDQLEFTTAANLPRVTTGAVVHNYPTYADATFTVDDTGGAGVVLLHNGLCWSTSHNPTTADAKTDAGPNLAGYELGMRPLKPNTTYYYRAYATNSAGTVYGNEQSFKTGDFAFGQMTDADGNKYKTIRIGNRTWMAENLRVTHYRNGDIIPEVADTSWNGQKQGAYCYYNNDPKNNIPYGKLYNYYVAHDVRQIAPAGWRVPNHDDIKDLMFYFLMVGDAKESGPEHWKDDGDNTNKYGFTAVGSGVRFNFGFVGLRQFAVYWSSEYWSDKAGQAFGISDNTDGLFNLSEGLSIRLVTD